MAEPEAKRVKTENLTLFQATGPLNEFYNAVKSFPMQKPVWYSTCPARHSDMSSMRRALHDMPIFEMAARVDAMASVQKPAKNAWVLVVPDADLRSPFLPDRPVSVQLLQIHYAAGTDPFCGTAFRQLRSAYRMLMADKFNPRSDYAHAVFAMHQDDLISEFNITSPSRSTFTMLDIDRRRLIQHRASMLMPLRSGWSENDAPLPLPCPADSCPRCSATCKLHIHQADPDPSRTKLPEIFLP